MSIYHVYPINDTNEHDTESSTCICRPVVELLINGDILMTHNSFDGREGLELAQEVLNKQ